MTWELRLGGTLGGDEAGGWVGLVRLVGWGSRAGVGGVVGRTTHGESMGGDVVAKVSDGAGCSMVLGILSLLGRRQTRWRC
jgi:hypothetical protein